MPATAAQLKFARHDRGIGSFWTSPATPASLRQCIRDMARTGFKEASIGGDQESSFEQAFSSLAYGFIKDKSPRLLDFVVGFQLVDRNEDNTKAMGIFGYKVGDQWLYGPCFFLNGDLKGHELLYIKKQDVFVPMKENWVNYLISRRPHVLGEGTEGSVSQLGVRMPSLGAFRHGGARKRASVQVAAWAEPFMGFIGAVASRDPSVMHKQEKLAERLDLRTALDDFGMLKLAYEKCYLQYPAIKQGFDKFYGPNFFHDMAVRQKEKLAAADSLVKRAEAFISPPPRRKKVNKAPRDNYLIPLAEKKAEPHPTETGELQVHRRDYWQKKLAKLQARRGESLISPEKEAATEPVDEDGIGGMKINITPAEREKMLVDGFVIHDERPAERKSVAYNTQVELRLSNPTESGIFTVLEKPGTFEEMLVILSPHSSGGRERFATVVRKGDSRSWLNTDSTNLWCRHEPVNEKEVFQKYVDGLSGVDSLESGGTYVAVHENGSGTCPFRVSESYGDGAYQVDWLTHASENPSFPTHRGLDAAKWSGRYHSSWGCKLWINKKEGSGLRTDNGEMTIPSSYKIVKIEAPQKPEKNEGCLISCCSPPTSVSPCEAGSKVKPIEPGNLLDIQLGIETLSKAEKVARLQLQDVGAGEIWLKSARDNWSGRLGRTDALIGLVTDHGLPEVQARQMLKEAALAALRGKAATYLIKYADPFMGHGPTAPGIPEPEYGSEAVGRYNSVQSIYPQEQQLPVTDMSAQNSDLSAYDPFYMPDQQAMQVAQQASNAGQKEVFDTTMIAGMLKSVRQDSTVDRYLGDLMKALDKLGRLIFLLYWHQEEFEDRYGKQDMPELEDALRNSFEVLGDVVLFLKEKTVAGGAGMEMASGVGNPEPNIDDAAGN